MKKYFTLIGIFIALQASAQQADSAKTKDADYYMMKNKNVIHFLSTGEGETVLNTATLSNGIMITAKGEVVSKDGTKKVLGNGECVNAEGIVQDCAALDARISRQKEKK